MAEGPDAGGSQSRWGAHPAQRFHERGPLEQQNVRARLDRLGSTPSATKLLIVALQAPPKARRTSRAATYCGSARRSESWVSSRAQTENPGSRSAPGRAVLSTITNHIVLRSRSCPTRPTVLMAQLIEAVATDSPRQIKRIAQIMRSCFLLHKRAEFLRTAYCHPE
jgi:hypothetical protein